MNNRSEQLTPAATLHCGDCLDVLKTLPDNSIDSCVTDPPYHLTAVPMQSYGVQERNGGRSSEQKKARTGFMQKTWDGGDIAFRPELWAEVLRVLKPGGHLLSFGGDRTFHRMACAIEDAGFECRGTIAWIFGQGFPKSRNISAAIDKEAGVEREVVGPRMRPDGKPVLAARGGDETRSDGWDRPCHDPEKIAKNGMHTAPATDAARQWDGWGTALKPAMELVCLARKPLSEGTIAANVLKWGVGGLNIDKCRIETWEKDRCRCHSYAAPAAASPQPQTPGTRAFIAINDAAQTLSAKVRASREDIGRAVTGCSDGMRAENTCTNSSMSKSGKIEMDRSPQGLKSTTETATRETTAPRICSLCQKPIIADSISGRWPANCIHDGSEEVVGAFPETPGQQRAVGPTDGAKPSINVYGDYGPRDQFEPRNDSGSAARFFYQAKADSMDRLGSSHPTIKPVDLSQYLVRLVTPRGGLCLDPFAGTGTTGEACIREGMCAVLIEREAEYQQDIRRRMRLAMAGPDERSSETVKAKGKPVDWGPLFAVAGPP